MIILPLYKSLQSWDKLTSYILFEYIKTNPLIPIFISIHDLNMNIKKQSLPYWNNFQITTMLFAFTYGIPLQHYDFLLKYSACKSYELLQVGIIWSLPNRKYEVPTRMWLGLGCGWDKMSAWRNNYIFQKYKVKGYAFP